MKYILTMIKTFIFDQTAIKEIAETKIQKSILVFLFSEIMSFCAKLLIDGNNIGKVSKLVIFNLLILIVRIIILCFLLYRNISTSQLLLGIINANLIIGAIYCFIILIDKKNIYSIINSIVIVYSLYYLYRFLKIIFPKVRNIILEGTVILSALIAKIITIGLMMIFNTLCSYV